MATSSLRRIAISLLTILTSVATGAHAETTTRVRLESPYLQSVLAAAIDRSPTFQRLFEEINHSNVIVYITCEHFRSLLLRGQTTLMSGSADVRYVRVQVECMLPAADLAAIIGHELRHVNEIAAAAAVVDRSSFQRLYQSIGFAACGSWQSEHFETADAVTAGDRVRREYLDRPSQTHGRRHPPRLVFLLTGSR